MNGALGRRRAGSLARTRGLIGCAILSALLGCGEASSRRILVLGFDGLDPEALDLLLSEGKLPNFARLRREGAYGRLRSFEPMLSPVLWTTIATGKSPAQHGIGHFVARDPATGRDQPVTSDMRRVKALWNLFSEKDRRVGVLGWWATHPPEKVNGFMASDRLAFHFLFAQGFEAAEAGGTTYPPGLESRLRPNLRKPQEIGAAELERFVDVPASDLARPFDLEDDLQHFRWVVATMTAYRDIGVELWKSERPDLLMAYFEGTDSAAHLFGHLFRARGLSGELEEQRRRYGSAVEEIYVFADEILGEFLKAIDSRTTLVVLSDHGFKLGVLPEDPSRLRDMRRVSERYHREEGVLFLHGAGVAAGRRIDGATLLDIAPTILAAAGIAPAKDMPGKVLTAAFARLDDPERVGSYENAGAPTEADGQASERPAGNAAAPSASDTALLEHLRSLGYLSGRSPQGDRNLAAIAFSEGQFERAERMYRALLETEPSDAGLRTSLAGALGQLGRLEEALAELDRALALDPLNVEGHHNRGAVLERLDRRAEAAASYREGLRYRPDYEPSISALARLGEPSSLPGRKQSPEEAAALALAARAEAAARSGAYTEALSLLARAEEKAPRLALVCQYQSNVAYLAGDVAASRRALERCLKLEPDNALYRVNLERLKGSTPAER